MEYISVLLIGAFKLLYMHVSLMLFGDYFMPLLNEAGRYSIYCKLSSWVSKVTWLSCQFGVKVNFSVSNFIKGKPLKTDSILRSPEVMIVCHSNVHHIMVHCFPACDRWFTERFEGWSVCRGTVFFSPGACVSRQHAVYSWYK